MSSAIETSAADPRPGGEIRRIVAGLATRPLVVLASILVAAFLLIALLAPLLAPYDPLALNVMNKLSPPGGEHWLGTDHLGRDLLSRIVYGARTALGIAIAATLGAGVAGLLLGLAAGYGPRWLDALLVLLLDSLSAVPMIMLALAIITVLGPGTQNLIFVIALTSTPGYARLVRAQALGLRNAEFIQAERALGASPARVLMAHMLPNVVGPLLILVSMDIPVVIMLEAGLSFLGLGVRPPTPSWGSILYDGYTSLRVAPWLVFLAGAPLVLATIGFTFLGEGVRDVLDPRLDGRRGP